MQKYTKQDERMATPKIYPSFKLKQIIWQIWGANFTSDWYWENDPSENGCWWSNNIYCVFVSHLWKNIQMYSSVFHKQVPFYLKLLKNKNMSFSANNGLNLLTNTQYFIVFVLSKVHTCGLSTMLATWYTTLTMIWHNVYLHITCIKQMPNLKMFLWIYGSYFFLETLLLLICLKSLLN